MKANSGALPTPELFDKIAEVYDQFTSGLSLGDSSMNEWIASQVPPRCGRILDVGCGAGRHCDLLARHADEVIAIDRSENMIELARRRRSLPRVEYRVCSVFDMSPDRDGLFDVVFAFSCILHVGHPEKVLQHLRKLVAPRGCLLVVEPQRPPTYEQDSWQVNLAFDSALAMYELTGEVDDAVGALRLFLDPSWLQISKISVPLDTVEFHRIYRDALPGAVIEDWPHPLGAHTARWRALE